MGAPGFAQAWTAEAAVATCFLLNPAYAYVLESEGAEAGGV
jgi:hypothetical protein